jgi:hypothetical protein
VQGKVTLDGQPLTGGGVQFFHILQADENLPPNASLTFVSELGDDGSFKLDTPVGRYRVRFVQGDKADQGQWGKVPGPYQERVSPLVVEVVENKPEGGYDIQLSSKEKPKVNMKEILAEKRKWRSKGKQ